MIIDYQKQEATLKNVVGKKIKQTSKQTELDPFSMTD